MYLSSYRISADTLKHALAYRPTGYHIQVDQVAVVVGGNDFDCTSSTTASITEDMTKLIAAAKKVGSNIKVSSILHGIQTKCSTSHIKMDQVNINIKQFCSSDPACEFIDHSTNFTLSDNQLTMLYS